MTERNNPRAAIINYGMGNLFSVKHACENSGLAAIITSSKQEIMTADAVILPGVGAFGDAMEALRQLGLTQVLQEVATSTKPFLGICLGMQLLMTESYEFSHHQGLDIIKGSVVRFDNSVEAPGKGLTIPHVGWNHIYRVKRDSQDKSLESLILKGITDGEFMYFVHSYYVKSEDMNICLTTSRYGNTEFCSSIQYRNTFTFQFHPERSGSQGLKIYRNLASLAKQQQ